MDAEPTKDACRGGRGKKVKPIRETKYGRQLLTLSASAVDRGGDFERGFLDAVSAGDDYASVAGRFGISYEMAQYTVRRLIRRYEALAKLAEGLIVLELHRDRLAEAGLTDTQREALVMLLAGRSQAHVARELDITQAAVSSRLRLASRLLKEAATAGEWVKPLADAVAVRRSRNTLTAFQRKGAPPRAAGAGTAEPDPGPEAAGAV
jgi:DNA-binding CsgD family transcriptional regulator